MPLMQQLELTEASQENPVPPSVQPPAKGELPRRATSAARAWANGCCVIFFIIAMNGVYAGFLYGTIKAIIEPLPRGIINHTYRGLIAFEGFMAIFGILVAGMDAFILWACFGALPLKKLHWSFICCGALLVFPFLLGAPIMIFSLGWVVPAVMSKSAYAHACDSDWMEILLTAHTRKTAASRNIATFSLVETREVLWTWTSNDPFQNDFNFISFNSTSPSLLPSLGNVTINHTTNELERAWCYGTTDQCATGYVWPFDGLSFEVKFNGTLTRMRSRYNDWSFGDVPSVIMHRVDENGQLAERLMQTSITNPKSCRQLKVCVSRAMQRREGVVDPDVLVAAYWLLHKQAIYARKCTRKGKNK